MEDHRRPAAARCSIPNAGYPVQIPCGTLAIDAHLHAENIKHDPFDVDAEVDIEWPSLAGGQRYQAVLYIEKEGFEPLLKEERIAERFDLAILSCKGQSVVAARKYVDCVCHVNGGTPLFVAHDMDKSGFEISQRLTSVSEWAEEKDRVTYRFRNEINVTDLGLRLADAERYGLTGEAWEFRGGFADDSIATADEQEYLRSGRRIELNEFTPAQFLEWLGEKLTERLPNRLIPADDVLDAAYRRALVVARINAAIDEAKEEVIEKALAATLPSGLRKKLEKALKKKNSRPWDQAVYDLAAEAVEEDD